MRRMAEVGDYIAGLSPGPLPKRFVYAMRVSETIGFDEYWRDPCFLAKRPDMAAGGDKGLGDNIYWRDTDTGDWRQEWSHHSNDDGTQDWRSTRDDTGSDKVLVGRDFIYWGGVGPPLPDSLADLIVGRGYRCNFRPEVIEAFIKWFKSHRNRDLVGMPTNGLPAPARAQGRHQACRFVCPGHPRKRFGRRPLRPACAAQPARSHRYSPS